MFDQPAEFGGILTLPKWVCSEEHSNVGYIPGSDRGMDNWAFAIWLKCASLKKKKKSNVSST